MKDLFKKKSWQYVFNSAIIYVFVLVVLFFTSQGLDATDIALLCRMGVPVAVLAYVLQVGIEKSIFSKVYIPHFFIGLSWIGSGPVLFFVANHADLQVIYTGHDVFFGMYLSLLLIALQDIALSIIRKPKAAMAVSLCAVAMVIVPVIQVVYFVIYGGTITDKAMLAIQRTNVLEAVIYGQTGGGITIVLGICVFIACLLAAFGYSDKKVMYKAIWGEKPSGKRIILILITVILLVYMSHSLIWNTEFIGMWQHVAKSMQYIN
jgi:hypothetical protein